MRWRPRLLSRTRTTGEVPAFALNFELPSVTGACDRAAVAATREWAFVLAAGGSTSRTVPLQPPESAGQATRTLATPEALTPTVCRGIVTGTRLAAGGSPPGLVVPGSVV